MWVAIDVSKNKRSHKGGFYGIFTTAGLLHHTLAIGWGYSVHAVTSAAVPVDIVKSTLFLIRNLMPDIVCRVFYNNLSFLPSRTRRL